MTERSVPAEAVWRTIFDIDSHAHASYGRPHSVLEIVQVTIETHDSLIEQQLGYVKGSEGYYWPCLKKVEHWETYSQPEKYLLNSDQTVVYQDADFKRHMRGASMVIQMALSLKSMLEVIRTAPENTNWRLELQPEL